MYTKYLDFTVISDNERVFKPIEVTDNDALFRPIRMPSMNYDSNILRSEHFTRPDYTRHVFSNMGRNLFTLDERNIALPIREYEDITEYGNLNINNHDMAKSHAQGVFIIERYNIYDVTSINIEKLFYYYRDVVKLDKGTLEYIANKITKCTPGNYVTIRFVTYVPKADIQYHTRIYSPKTNLCIVNGCMSKDICHPRSEIRKEGETKKELIKNVDPTLFMVDIVDNENPNKPYYITIGKHIHKIDSYRTELKESGAKISIKRNNTIIGKETFYRIDKLEEVGIYDSEDKAMFEGDAQVKLEHKKLLLEDKKLTAADNKIRLTLIQLKHEESMNKLEKEIKKLSYKATVFKLEYDYNTSVVSMARDKELFRQKMKQEDHKTLGTVISFGATLVKTLSTFI